MSIAASPTALLDDALSGATTSRSFHLPDTALPTATWRDWSCLVRLVVTDPDALMPAMGDLGALMRQVDDAASRFRPDSELAKVNAHEGRPTVVSRTLVDLVDAALRAAKLSAGAVDPTLGLDLDRLGYDRDFGSICDDDAPVERRPETGTRPDWRDLQLDRLAGILTVPAGCALDLGATAKAMTADWAAEQLHDRYGCDVLVEIGGDLAVAGAKDDWQVQVAERGGQEGQQVTLGAGGLATSTTTIRRWRRGTQDVSHLVDPFTGAPVNGPWRTVTVAAASATRANTCSTGAIVLGVDAFRWLQSQGVAARLVDRHGGVVTTGGWPE